MMSAVQNSTMAPDREGLCKGASSDSCASATLDLQIRTEVTAMSQANVEDEAADAASDEMMVEISSAAAMSSHSHCGSSASQLFTAPLLSPLYPTFSS
ncbi:hypothetical protein CLOP_g22613 [Closterium sp. NIES-67]|nr:hypothetical protein CLOP_g22613 [Closterium sp. NIES-67]